MARALVLGGGGVTGVAWELGLLAGLAAAGVDLTGADLVVGTSAGFGGRRAVVLRGAGARGCTRRSWRRPGGEVAARLGFGGGGALGVGGRCVLATRCGRGPGSGRWRWRRVRRRRRRGGR